MPITIEAATAALCAELVSRSLPRLAGVSDHIEIPDCHPIPRAELDALVAAEIARGGMTPDEAHEYALDALMREYRISDDDLARQQGYWRKAGAW